MEDWTTKKALHFSQISYFIYFLSEIRLETSGRGSHQPCFNRGSSSRRVVGHLALFVYTNSPNRQFREGRDGSVIRIWSVAVSLRHW